MRSGPARLARIPRVAQRARIARLARVAWLVLVAPLAASSEASAHPHVFVSVKSVLVLDAEKRFTAVKQIWTFDEMYTAFAVTGFGKDSLTPSPDDLQTIAQQNMEDMADYHYFTTLKSPAGAAAFAKPVDYSAALVKTSEDESLQLRFTLPLATPMPIGRSLSFQVYDPSYFVSFTFAKQDGVAFEGDGGACSTNLTQPRPLSATDQASLTESFFTNMLPGTDFGIKLAQIVNVICR